MQETMVSTRSDRCLRRLRNNDKELTKYCRADKCGGNLPTHGHMFTVLQGSLHKRVCLKTSAAGWFIYQLNNPAKTNVRKIWNKNNNKKKTSSKHQQWRIEIDDERVGYSCNNVYIHKRYENGNVKSTIWNNNRFEEKKNENINGGKIRFEKWKTKKKI